MGPERPWDASEGSATHRPQVQPLGEERAPLTEAMRDDDSHSTDERAPSVSELTDPPAAAAGFRSALAQARQGGADPKVLEDTRAQFLRTLGGDSDDPLGLSATPAETVPLTTTPPPSAGAPLQVAHVVETITEVSPSLARMVGDRVVIEEGGALIRLQVAAGTSRLLDPQKLAQCRQQLESLRGGSVKLELEQVEIRDDDEAPQSVDSYDVPGATPPPAPEIVEKAIEIFRGEVQARFRSRPTS